MSTLKTTNIQNASSATTNIALDTSGGVTVGAGITASSGTVVMSSPYTMRNKIINGAMVIDQRNAGASVTPAGGAYTLDRWLITASQASKFSVQQSTTAPAGFTNSLKVTSLSAYTVAAGDYFSVQQRVEGYNIVDLAFGTSSAKTITLSFWVYSSLTGTFGGAVQNNTGLRSYPFTYTISAANTWEQKTITVVGETSGTWLTSNNLGLIVNFGLGTGTTYSGPAGSWGTVDYESATGATSVVGTNGATWYVTGVQLERGTVATPFEYRNYQQELAMCQRYYWQVGGTGATALPIGQAASATVAYIPIVFPVTLRTAPTFSVSANSDWYMTNASVGGSLTWTASSIGGADPQSCYLAITVASGLAAGNASMAQAANSSARAKFSAEL